MGFLKKLKFWKKTNKGSHLKKHAEELEKKNVELQNKLESKDHEWEQVVAILRGLKCECDDLSAASDGEMDANQVYVEDFKLSEHSLKQTHEEKSVESTLQHVKILKEDKDLEIDEIRLAVEDTKHITEVNDFVLSFKVTFNKLKKDCQGSKKIQKKLQENLQTLKNMNNQLEKTLKDCDKEKEILVMRNMALQKELEQMKITNDNTNKYWESKMKYCEEEKNTFLICNQELRKEIKAVQNLQLLDGSSEPQGRQCVTDTADDGKISLQKFKFIRRLGEGAFGTVVLAKGKILGEPEKLYALKAVKKQGVNSGNISVIMAEKEALMLTTGHPFITTLYSCFQDKDRIFFVMEFMSGGDLKNQLDKVSTFSEKRTQFYAAEITLAVQFLHQHGILHRDLKLENVLLDSDGHCKITDFGLAKLGMFRYCKTKTQCGTPLSLAPEIVKNLRYDKGVDWWAVGVMIFQMLTGHPPFYCDEEENALNILLRKIVNDEIDFLEHVSLPATSIVLQLLMKDPKQRLGSKGTDDKIRQHICFRGIDWQALQDKTVKPPELENVPENTEEDTHSFGKVLKVEKSPDIINRKLFRGFSFINYRAKPTINLQQQVSEM
jgi:serine/threonine protein kinase